MPSALKATIKAAAEVAIAPAAASAERDQPVRNVARAELLGVVMRPDERTDDFVPLQEELDQVAPEKTSGAGDEGRQLIGTCRSRCGSIRSRMSVRLGPVAVMP